MRKRIILDQYGLRPNLMSYQDKIASLNWASTNPTSATAVLNRLVTNFNKEHMNRVDRMFAPPSDRVELVDSEIDLTLVTIFAALPKSAAILPPSRFVL